MPPLLDSADWHDELAADVDGSPYAPAGFVVAWLADHGLLSDQVFTDFGMDIAKCISRSVSPLYLYRMMDGKLSDSDVRSQFLSFVRDTVLGTLADRETIFSIADSWDAYATLKQDFDSLYAKWLESQSR